MWEKLIFWRCWTLRVNACYNKTNKQIKHAFLCLCLSLQSNNIAWLTQHAPVTCLLWLHRHHWENKRNAEKWWPLAFDMFECFPTSHYLYFRFTKEETEPREIKAFAQSLMKLSGSEVHTVTTMVGSLQNVPESAHSWVQGRASVVGPCLFFCPKGLYRVAQEEPYLTPSSP